MGRPRIKNIDDSTPEAEVKKQKSKVKTSDKTEVAKLEPRNDSVTLSEAKGINPELDSSPASPDQNDKNDAEDRHVVSQSETPRDDEKDSGQARMTKEKKPQKPGKAKPRSKKYQELTKDLDRTKIYSLTEAIDMVKKLSYSKFDATLEAHVNTAQTGIRGLVSLPFATGRKLRILVFGKDADSLSSIILNEAKRSEESPTNVGLKQTFEAVSPQAESVERSFASAQDDTIKIGNDETIEEINKGKIDFDIVVTTPEWMPKLAKVARILGPRGLMPNPKNGTITDDLKKAVEGFQAGKTEYKTESKAPVIHLALGRLNQSNEELSANIKTLYQTIGKSRVKKITLSPTMGPGVKVDLSSI